MSDHSFGFFYMNGLFALSAHAVLANMGYRSCSFLQGQRAFYAGFMCKETRRQIKFLPSQQGNQILDMHQWLNWVWNYPDVIKHSV